MTQKQIEILRKYEYYLSTATQSNYVRSIPMKDAQVLAQIYMDLGNGKPNLNCGKCVLNMCRVLGRAFYSQKCG